MQSTPQHTAHVNLVTKCPMYIIHYSAAVEILLLRELQTYNFIGIKIGTQKTFQVDCPSYKKKTFKILVTYLSFLKEPFLFLYRFLEKYECFQSV